MMLATAIVKDNNLIIPNIDLSTFHGQIDEFGMVEIDLNFLNKSKKLTEPKLKNILKKHLSVADVSGSLKDKTTVKATIEEMNDSIAQAYKNWEC